MATVSKETGLELLKNGGWYPGDPQCQSIWAYWSGYAPHDIQIAIYWDGTILQSSEFVYCPILLWTAAGGLTEEGRKFLAEQ